MSENYEVARRANELRESARALWAVRVLDAWADGDVRRYRVVTWFTERNLWRTKIKGSHDAEQIFSGDSPDAARLAAAVTIMATDALPADVRTALGECP
jgi:hypothetical protein